MANIRLSNAGGVFATGATWDGGVAPGSTDTWYADANSGNLTLGASAITRAFDLTGYTGILDLASYYLLPRYDGQTYNVKLSTGMSITATTGYIYFYTSNSSTVFNFYPCGVTVPKIILYNGTLALQGALTVSGALTVTVGTFSANGYTTTLGSLATSNTNTRNITFADVFITGTGTVWNTTDITNLTLTCNGTVAITNTSAVAKTIAAGGANLGNFSVAGGGGGAILFTTDVTVNNLAFNHPKTITVTVGKTITVSGTIGNSGTSAPSRVTLKSSVDTVPFTLSKASGVVSVDWWSIQDCAASGGATFYAGANSTDVSGNTGWIFTGVPGGYIYVNRGSMTGGMLE